MKKYNETDIADCIRRPEFLIIKIHGSVDSTDNLIFTRRDYSEARSKYRDFYHLVDALSITHTFIFIGCGVNDPDIRLILEDYSFKYPSNKKHYIVMAKDAVSSKVRDIVSETMSLTPLLYDPANYHQKLTDSLKELVEKVDQKRSDLASTTKW